MYPRLVARARRSVAEGFTAATIELRARVPDLRAQIQRAVFDAESGQTWSAWEMIGTTTDGEPITFRGVVISTAREGKMACAPSSRGWAGRWGSHVLRGATAPGQKGWWSGNVSQALRGNASGAHQNVFPLMAAQAAGIEGADSAQTLELPLDVPPPPLAAL
ncbi:hypothetical protein WMF45_38665 [Sorangium sp. So ce448]|uniref:hypothetical protein n=1 Tax=Sorangium sp. So ce448 TaxID=3133314 RepID=UPI003F6437C7